MLSLFDQVSWAELKTFVDTRRLNIQYRETSDFYHIKAADSWFGVYCNIHKINDSADVAVFEASYKASGNKGVLSRVSAFAEKNCANGKGLYTRIHGVVNTVHNSLTNIDFVIPYNTCKLTGLEIISGSIGDVCSFKVYDTPSGTISGYADLLLNQFGANVNVAKDFYKYTSNYDADLIKDMKLRIEYDPIDSAESKNIYVNLFLHEVK